VGENPFAAPASIVFLSGSYQRQFGCRARCPIPDGGISLTIPCWSSTLDHPLIWSLLRSSRTPLGNFLLRTILAIIASYAFCRRWPQSAWDYVRLCRSFH